MSHTTETHSADVVLERGTYSWIWVVAQCPYCGQAHEHYAGPLDAAPQLYPDVEQLASCSKRRRQAMQQGPDERLTYTLERAG
jgi:hypothetical protein